MKFFVIVSVKMCKSYSPNPLWVVVVFFGIWVIAYRIEKDGPKITWLIGVRNVAKNWDFEEHVTIRRVA